jgi:hypothetical protein
VGTPTTLRQLLTSPAVVKTIVLRDVTVACSANGCKTEMAGDRADVIVFCDPEHLFLERPLNFNRQTGRHDDFPLLDWNCGREYRTAVKSGVMKGGVVLNIHDVLKRFRKNEEQFGGLEAVLKDEEARHSAAYLANTPLSQITAQFMDEDLQGWRESADSVFEQTSDACAALWAAIEAKSADLKRQLSADEVRDLPQWQAYEDAAKGLCHVRGIPEHKVKGILARAEAPSIDPELITPWVVGLWNGNETEYLVLPERQARMAAYLRYVGFCAQKGNVIGFSDYCRKYAGLQPLLALRAALRAVEAAKLAKIEASRVTLATKFQGLGKLVETIRAASEDAPVVLDKHDGRRDHRGGRDRRHSAGN